MKTLFNAFVIVLLAFVIILASMAQEAGAFDPVASIPMAYGVRSSGQAMPVPPAISIESPGELAVAEPQVEVVPEVTIAVRQAGAARRRPQGYASAEALAYQPLRRGHRVVSPAISFDQKETTKKEADK